MKPSHLGTVKALIAELPPDERPDNIEDNIMTWAFVGGTLDPNKRTPQNSLFFFATEPEKLTKMMPGLEDLTGEERAQLEQAIVEMVRDPKAVVIGAETAAADGQARRRPDEDDQPELQGPGVRLHDHRRVPVRLRAGSTSAVMNRSYLDNELDAYRGRTGKEHPLADKSMNLIWVRLPNPRGVRHSVGQAQRPRQVLARRSRWRSNRRPTRTSCRRIKTLLWFMKWPLSLGLLAITTLVASLVIGIGVRERKTEIAVLKVLGFRPWMVLGLVLGEALLVGVAERIHGDRDGVFSGQRAGRTLDGHRVLQPVLHPGGRALVGPAHWRHDGADWVDPAFDQCVQHQASQVFSRVT